MDALTFLLQILFRSLILLLPITVAMLAFRRLALSQSSNAWLYAATAMVACVTAAGLAPWAIIGTNAVWIFFVLAVFCPALWLGVVIICDQDRLQGYDASSEEAGPPRKLSPLVLEGPVWPDAPTPVFRHRGAEQEEPRTSNVFSSVRGAARDKASEQAQTVLEIARAMRGNVSSQHRREPRRLPPPTPRERGERLENLPFLRPYPQN